MNDNNLTIDAGQTTTFCNTFTCRWCGVENREKKERLCAECKAGNATTMWLHGFNNDDIKFYHNPDNSLFIDFVSKDGKTARYVLSPQKLMELGLLRLYDTDPQGKRCP